MAVQVREHGIQVAQLLLFNADDIFDGSVAHIELM
jgi:hypothetical protein